MHIINISQMVYHYVFSRKKSFIPNIEFKFPKLDIDFWTLDNHIEVAVNDDKLFISPLELQIPF